MNPLLIIRTDILSTIIVLLIIYDVYCSKFQESENRFLGIALACLGHDVMALVTELTVNLDNVPTLLNDTVHRLFYIFSVLFAKKYFEYTLYLIMPKKNARKYRIGSNIVCIAAFILLVIAPISYLQGRGTCYSDGLWVKGVGSCE